MKRLLAILLTFIMVVGFSGCSDDDKKTSSKPSAQKKSPTYEGVISGNKYENYKVKLGCELPAGWSFHTKKEIEEINKQATDSANSQLAEDLKNADLIYAMSAYSSDNSATVKVTLEKKSQLSDLEALAKNTVLATKNAYGELIKSAIVSETLIEKKSFVSTDISFLSGPTTIYSKTLYDVCDSYLVCITISAKSQNTVDNLVKEFYLL